MTRRFALCLGFAAVPLGFISANTLTIVMGLAVLAVWAPRWEDRR